MNSEKRIYYCLVVIHWKCQNIGWYELWEKCLLLFGSNSLKVLFDIKSEKSVYYFFVVIHLMCQLVHFIDAFVEGRRTLLLRYLNHVFEWQHTFAENANLKESTAAKKYLSRWSYFFFTHMLCIAPLVILHLIFLILVEHTSFHSHSNYLF